MSSKKHQKNRKEKSGKEQMIPKDFMSLPMETSEVKKMLQIGHFQSKVDIMS